MLRFFFYDTFYFMKIFVAILILCKTKKCVMNKIAKKCSNAPLYSVRSSPDMLQDAEVQLPYCTVTHGTVLVLSKKKILTTKKISYEILIPDAGSPFSICTVPLGTLGNIF